MKLRRLLGLTAVVAVAAAGVFAGPAAAQTPLPPAVADKLNRVAADLYSPSPRPAAAIEELTAILAEDPGIAEAHMLLGIAYRIDGSPERVGQAVAELRQALGLKPDLVQARLVLARVYIDMSRPQRAREELEVALEQMPGHPQLLSLLGEAERQLGDAARGVSLNSQALKADAALVQARYYRGLAYLDLGQQADAVQDLELVVKSGVNPAEANAALGRAYIEARRTKEGIAALREALRADPLRLDAHVQLVRAYRVTKQLKQAEAQLLHARRAGQDGISELYQSLEPELYMEEALVRTALGRLEAAAQSFQRVLALDPSHEAAARGLAEVRKRLKEKTAGRKPGAS